MGDLIELKNLTKNYDDLQVLKGINLTIKENEFLTLLGPSGCGKTTILRIIGGFLKQDEGTVIFDGECIDELPAYKREINTVFQKYALFPHMDVYDNIAFGLRIKKVGEDVIEQKVNRMLALVNLEGFEHRNVTLLSGGQQQRVAIARALVTRPSLILGDEPTGNLDSHTTQEIMDMFHALHEQGNTIVLITHDNNVAKTAKRIIHILDGKLSEVSL